MNTVAKLLLVFAVCVMTSLTAVELVYGGGRPLSAVFIGLGVVAAASYGYLIHREPVVRRLGRWRVLLVPVAAVAITWFSFGTVLSIGRNLLEWPVKLVSRAAERGDVEAQFGLGSMYIQGAGVPQDIPEGLKWLREAADQGLAKAQYVLGYMYQQGRAVPQDYVQAYMWSDLAAARGHHKARRVLNEITDKMTADQIGEAQKLARQWKLRE